VTDHHLVLTSRLGVAERRAEVAANTAPRHFFLELADALGGEVHEPAANPPETGPTTVMNRILRTPPGLIALARHLGEQVGDRDVVFCLGEAVALPLAQELMRRGKSTRLVSFGHNLNRPRVRAADLLSGCVRRVDHFHVFTQGALTTPDRFSLYCEQTDDRFFSPGEAPSGPRPRIVSVGLERRDYVTLAEAVRGLDAEVRVSAFSSDARAGDRAFPTDLPANMDRRFYSWPDLVALYRSADLVVIPLEPSTYAAGITTLLEAAAVGCPVIASDTGGLRDAFNVPDAVEWVPPGDADALRVAITGLLGNPDRRARLARDAHAAQQTHHSLQGRVRQMAAALRAP